MIRLRDFSISIVKCVVLAFVLAWLICLIVPTNILSLLFITSLISGLFTFKLDRLTQFIETYPREVSGKRAQEVLEHRIKIYLKRLNFIRTTDIVCSGLICVTGIFLSTSNYPLSLGWFLVLGTVYFFSWILFVWIILVHRKLLQEREIDEKKSKYNSEQQMRQDRLKGKLKS